MKKDEKTTVRSTEKGAKSGDSSKRAATKKSAPREIPTGRSPKTAKRNNIGAIHNDFVVNFLSQKERAANFLESNLPPELAEQVDWANLIVESTAFSDEKNRTHYGDLSFSAPFKKRDDGELINATFFVVLEHKSNVERLLPLQILKYVALQAERLAKSDGFKGAKRPPFPIAFVLYNGAKPWRKRRTLRQLFYAGENAERFIPEFEYVALDLAATKEDDLRGNETVRTFLSLLKSATDGTLRQALTTTLHRFFKTANLVWDAATKDLVRSFFQYIADVAHNRGFRVGKSDYQQMLKGIGEQTMSQVKTFIDEYREEGREEGRGQGLGDAIVKTLRFRFGDDFVSDDTIEQIDAINDYPTLEKVFAAAMQVRDANEFQQNLRLYTANR